MRIARRLAPLLVLLCVAAAPLRAAERSIDKQVVVNATLDPLWAAWTTREGIARCFAPDAAIDARVGGAFRRSTGRNGWPC